MSLENRAEVSMEQELRPPTEVLDAMPEFSEFFKREGEENYDPNQIDFWFIVGLSGVGKSVVAGQLEKFIRRNLKRKRLAGEAKVYNAEGREVGTGKDILVSVQSWDDYLREQVKIDPQAEWGNLSVDAYNQGAVNMATGLVSFKTSMVFNSAEAATLIGTLPLFPGPRGGAPVLDIFSDRRIKVIALTAEDAVLGNAAFIRDALNASKEAFLSAIASRGLIIDIDLTDENYEYFKHAMGTSASIVRHEEDTAIRMLDAKEDLEKWWKEMLKKDGTAYEPFPSFDQETLRSDPVIREKVKPIYYDYYLGERLKLPREKYVIMRNLFLPKVNFYLSALMPKPGEFSA